MVCGVVSSNLIATICLVVDFLVIVVGVAMGVVIVFMLWLWLS